MDASDKLSISILIIGFVLVVAIFIYLPYEDSHVLNMVTVIGSISSTAAAIIALIQIIKIKSSNDIFLSTMQVVGNNLIIDVISRSIEQVRLIKEYFEMGEARQARTNFSVLKTEIIKILNFKKDDEFKAKLSDFVSFCNKIETSMYDNTLGESKEDLSKVYARLSDLESFLQEVNVSAKLQVNKI